MTSREPLRHIISRIGELPTLPSVILKINALLSNPRTTAAEVGVAIASDQAIAAKLIRLVNSALYGFPGRISTINHAIVILGFSTVKNIVLTTAILSRFNLRQNISGFDMQGLWTHSLSTAAIARLIAAEMHFKGREEAFVGGLLHDLGKAIHALYLPEQFAEILETTHHKGLLFLDAERELHGTDHAAIGSWIAEKWNLPADLSAVITYHHQPSAAGEFSRLAGIVHIADILARGLQAGHPGDRTVPIADPNVWQDLQLDSEKLERILRASNAEIEKAKIFLTVND